MAFVRRNSRWNARGSILWELVWALGLLVAVVLVHLQVLRAGLQRVQSLEALRLPFDGGAGECNVTDGPLPWGR